jgi:hypothetical protein
MQELFHCACGEASTTIAEDVATDATKNVIPVAFPSRGDQVLAVESLLLVPACLAGR